MDTHRINYDPKLVHEVMALGVTVEGCVRAIAHY